MRSLLAAVLAASLLWYGCGSSPPKDGATPSPTKSTADAGRDDAGADDAGIEDSDAGTDDAGAADAGGSVSDAGADDAGAADAGQEVADAGPEDTGEEDAGTSDGGVVDAGVITMAVNDFCAQALQAQCAWSVRCGTSQDAQLCFDRRMAFGWDCVQPLALGAWSGRLLLVSASAQQCFTFISQSMSCVPNSEPFFSDPVCAAAVAGTVATGGTCFTDWECADSDYCDESATCPGVCAARTLAGLALSAGGKCASDLYLGADGNCHTPGVLGGSCSPSRYGSCAADLWCDSSGTCVALGAQGAPCPLPKGGGCASGLYCSANHTCSPMGQAGDACDAPQACLQDLTCDSTTYAGTGTCVPFKSAGGSCWTRYDCQPGLQCSAANRDAGQKGQCATAPLVACTTTADCDAHHYCDQGQCRTQEPIGAACQQGGQCETQLCGDAGICEPLPSCQE